MKEIDPEGYYSIKESCRFFPSARGGCIHKETLRLWCRRHGIKIHVQRTTDRRYRFVLGRDLLTLLRLAFPAPAEVPETPAQKHLRVEKAAQKCKSLGI
jgi:hypothetical protein